MERAERVRFLGAKLLWWKFQALIPPAVWTFLSRLTRFLAG